MEVLSQRTAPRQANLPNVGGANPLISSLNALKSIVAEDCGFSVRPIKTLARDRSQFGKAAKRIIGVVQQIRGDATPRQTAAAFGYGENIYWKVTAGITSLDPDVLVRVLDILGYSSGPPLAETLTAEGINRLFDDKCLATQIDSEGLASAQILARVKARIIEAFSTRPNSLTAWDQHIVDYLTEHGSADVDPGPLFWAWVLANVVQTPWSLTLCHLLVDVGEMARWATTKYAELNLRTPLSREDGVQETDPDSQGMVKPLAVLTADSLDDQGFAGRAAKLLQVSSIDDFARVALCGPDLVRKALAGSVDECLQLKLLLLVMVDALASRAAWNACRINSLTTVAKRLADKWPRHDPWARLAIVSRGDPKRVVKRFGGHRESIEAFLTGAQTTLDFRTRMALAYMTANTGRLRVFLDQLQSDALAFKKLKAECRSKKLLVRATVNHRMMRPREGRVEVGMMPRGRPKSAAKHGPEAVEKQTRRGTPLRQRQKKPVIDPIEVACETEGMLTLLKGYAVAKNKKRSWSDDTADREMLLFEAIRKCFSLYSPESVSEFFGRDVDWADRIYRGTTKLERRDREEVLRKTVDFCPSSVRSIVNRITAGDPCSLSRSNGAAGPL